MLLLKILHRKDFLFIIRSIVLIIDKQILALKSFLYVASLYTSCARSLLADFFEHLIFTVLYVDYLEVLEYLQFAFIWSYNAPTTHYQ